MPLPPEHEIPENYPETYRDLPMAVMGPSWGIIYNLSTFNEEWMDKLIEARKKALKLLKQRGMPESE